MAVHGQQHLMFCNDDFVMHDFAIIVCLFRCWQGLYSVRPERLTLFPVSCRREKKLKFTSFHRYADGTMESADLMLSIGIIALALISRWSGQGAAWRLAPSIEKRQFWLHIVVGGNAGVVQTDQQGQRYLRVRYGWLLLPWWSTSLQETTAAVVFS